MISRRISRRCASALAKHKIEYNIETVAADELVRLQELEAERLNDAVQSEDRVSSDGDSTLRRSLASRLITC